jgi:hypothetical protein
MRGEGNRMTYYGHLFLCSLSFASLAQDFTITSHLSNAPLDGKKSSRRATEELIGLLLKATEHGKQHDIIDGDFYSLIYNHGANPNALFNFSSSRRYINQEKNREHSCLSWAFEQDHKELCALLLSLNANPYMVFGNRKTNIAEDMLYSKDLAWRDLYIKEGLKHYPSYHPINKHTQQTILLPPIYRHDDYTTKEVVQYWHKHPPLLSTALQLRGIEGNTVLHLAVDQYKILYDLYRKEDASLRSIIDTFIAYGSSLETIKNDSGETPFYNVECFPGLELYGDPSKTFSIEDCFRISEKPITAHQEFYKKIFDESRYLRESRMLFTDDGRTIICRFDEVDFNYTYEIKKSKIRTAEKKNALALFDEIDSEEEEEAKKIDREYRRTRRSGIKISDPKIIRTLSGL